MAANPKAKEGPGALDLKLELPQQKLALAATNLRGRSRPSERRMILVEERSHEELSDWEPQATENCLQEVVVRSRGCTIKRSQTERKSFGGGNCLSST